MRRKPFAIIVRRRGAGLWFDKLTTNGKTNLPVRPFGNLRAGSEPVEGPPSEQPRQDMRLKTPSTISQRPVPVVIPSDHKPVAATARIGASRSESVRQRWAHLSLVEDASRLPDHVGADGY